MTREMVMFDSGVLMTHDRANICGERCALARHLLVVVASPADPSIWIASDVPRW